MQSSRQPRTVCILAFLAGALKFLSRVESQTYVVTGEIADVILSDADADYISLYPVILLVGEQDFSALSGLTSRLLAALKSKGLEELLLQQYHVDTMPSAAWEAINATGKARIVAPAAIGNQVGCG